MRRKLTQFARPARCGFGAFNMTPVIDIVFLLLIFLVVVSKVIEAENFPISAAEGCDAAEISNEPQGQLTTVTVMASDNGRAIFAVDSRQVTGSGQQLVDRLSDMIEQRLSEDPSERVVSVRIDRDIEYSTAQYVLAALAQSSAANVQFAVLRDDDEPGP